MTDDKLFHLLIYIAFILTAFFGWFFYNKSRHEERKLLIEKGKAPYEPLMQRNKYKSVLLKAGIVVIFVGVGLLIITLLVNLNWTGKSDAIFPAILGICGGVGLILANKFGNKQKPEE